MKFIQLLAVILGVSTVTACHAQFRNTKWGDSIEAVLNAEQLTKEDFYEVWPELIYHSKDPVIVGGKELTAFYHFAEGGLTEGSYQLYEGSPLFSVRMESALTNYNHFLSLLEMKYGSATSEEMPDELVAILNSEFPLSPQNLEGLRGLWLEESEDLLAMPWPEFELNCKSTWANEEASIELNICFSTYDTQEFSSLDSAVAVGTIIRYKDSQNWEQGRVWRREQVEAELKRRKEQEKKALLKGL